MEEILKEIQSKLENDTRTPQEMYSMLKQLGLYMFTTNTISKDNVVLFCSTLLGMYDKLKKG